MNTTQDELAATLQYLPCRNRWHSLPIVMFSCQGLVSSPIKRQNFPSIFSCVVLGEVSPVEE